MLIETKNGWIEESLLRKVNGSLDNENENTTWCEWWLDDELMKRDVHVRLKKPPVAMSTELGSFR